MTLNGTPRQPLPFDDQAEPAHGTVGLGDSSRAATAILVPFLLSESTRLRRRPSARNAACEEAPSGQDHSHGVLPYRKAAGEDGSFVIHGDSPLLPAPSQRLPQHFLLCHGLTDRNGPPHSA